MDNKTKSRRRIIRIRPIIKASFTMKL